MHMLLSRSWRHRLLAAHVAAGAGMLGAGVALLAWGGSGWAGRNPVTAVLAAHLGLLAVVLGLVALGQIGAADPGEVPKASTDPAHHRTIAEP